MKAKFSFLFGIFSLISTTVFAASQWTIAIDPGHGGKDPVQSEKISAFMKRMSPFLLHEN